MLQATAVTHQCNVQINELSVSSYFHSLGPPCDSVESRYHNGFFRSDYSAVNRANRKELIRQHTERQNNVFVGVKCFERIASNVNLYFNYHESVIACSVKFHNSKLLLRV